MIQDTTHVVQAASTFPWSGLFSTLVTAAIGFLSAYFGGKHGAVKAVDSAVASGGTLSSSKAPR